MTALLAGAIQAAALSEDEAYELWLTGVVVRGRPVLDGAQGNLVGSGSASASVALPMAIEGSLAGTP